MGADANRNVDGTDETKVAIACQGGGSHTAFTAGALSEFVALPDGYELVGLSGTSGGAVCAFLAWNGLATSGPQRAANLLESFWSQVVARSPIDAFSNELAVWTTRLEESGAALPGTSPYLSPASRLAQQRLQSVLDGLVEGETVGIDGRDPPRLLVGAVDVELGTFETFVDDEVTVETVLASAALPTAFPAVEVHRHAYWDGLLSENPPLLDLLTGPRIETPDELWVIQVNPQTRNEVPRTLLDIEDRRNELAGNLALNKDVGVIEQVNDWLEAGYLPESEYKHVEVRTLRFDRDLPHSSKLDRSPSFVEGLIEEGRTDAHAFLEART